MTTEEHTNLLKEVYNKIKTTKEQTLPHLYLYSGNKDAIVNREAPGVCALLKAMGGIDTPEYPKPSNDLQIDLADYVDTLLKPSHLSSVSFLMQPVPVGLWLATPTRAGDGWGGRPLIINAKRAGWEGFYCRADNEDYIRHLLHENLCAPWLDGIRIRPAVSPDLNHRSRGPFKSRTLVAHFSQCEDKLFSSDTVQEYARMFAQHLPDQWNSPSAIWNSGDSFQMAWFRDWMTEGEYVYYANILIEAILYALRDSRRLDGPIQFDAVRTRSITEMVRLPGSKNRKASVSGPWDSGVQARFVPLNGPYHLGTSTSLTNQWPAKGY